MVAVEGAEVLDVVDAAGDVLTNDDYEQDQRFSPRAEAVADRRIVRWRVRMWAGEVLVVG